MTCSNCRTDARHSDAAGCCGGCGRFFKSLGAFERHWTTPEPGARVCVDPLTVETASGGALYETLPVPGGLAYRFVPTTEHPHATRRKHDH